MSTTPPSSPGSSTPGGELQQISPDAWPTANGNQTEHASSSAAAAALAPPESIGINSAAEQFRDNWERCKRNLQLKYGDLTDNDLLYVQGQEAALLNHLQQKTGRSRLEIEEALDFHL